MTLDKEKTKERLNKCIDIALEVGRVRREVWDERNLEEDDNYHWQEVHLARKVLLFECSTIIDELYGRDKKA